MRPGGDDDGVGAHRLAAGDEQHAVAVDAPYSRARRAAHRVAARGEPARRGFGIRLIEEALAYEVDGRATLEFPSPGLRCEIEIPLPSVAT